MKRLLIGLLLLLLPLAAMAQVKTTVSTAAEGSHVVCTGPCALYFIRITVGATAGFLMVFNSVTVPGDGAVQPQLCVPVAANSGIMLDYSRAENYTTGLTVAYSSGANCYTKTTSATATFGVGAQ